MTQIRTTRFSSPDTSRNQNLQLAGLVRPGVYAGYKVVPATVSGSTNWISVKRGTAEASVLVTSQGVRIEETGDLIAVAQVTNANPNGYRYDLVVAKYEFTADNKVEQTYAIVRGTYSASSDIEPLVPVAGQYQIPLAVIKVRPASGPANLDYADIINVRPSSLTQGEEISSLKAIVDPYQTNRIFVHEGIFPTFDGTSALFFRGGYSAPLSATELADPAIRYALFGITDDLEIVVIGTGETEDALPLFTNDALPLCVAKLSGAGSLSPVIESVLDVRFPISRQLVAVVEDEAYKSSLGDSVFDYVRVDVFKDLSGITTTTAATQASLSSAEVLNSSVTTAPWELVLDRGSTSLLFKPVSDIAGYAVIVTKDVFRDVSFRAQHFMVHVDADFPLVYFRYSTSSPTAGFSSPLFRPGQIVRIPAGEVQKLYIKFFVPAAYVNRAGGCRMFSYGCYLRLNQQVVNTATVTDVGVRSLKNAIPNLIANGNFRYWGRNDVNGLIPNPDAYDTITYRVTSTSPYAADGWQFMELSAAPVNNTISRVTIQTDIVGSAIGGTDTGLYWEIGSSQSSANTSTMEYRVPVSGSETGKFATFAISYRGTQAAQIAVGVAIYTISADGTVGVQSPIYVTAPTATGRLVVRTPASIPLNAIALGFIVKFADRTGSVTLYNASGAMGEYATLDYTEPLNAGDILRKYYERGRLLSIGNVLEGQQLAASTQFGAQKFTQLGSLGAQVVVGSAYNRSVNTAAPVFDISRNGIAVIASSLSSGVAKIDLDFEAYIRY